MMKEFPIFKQAAHEFMSKTWFPLKPIIEISDDFENKSGTDWVLKNISVLGRVLGTHWALLTG